jgi:hypothetical protein
MVKKKKFVRVHRIWGKLNVAENLSAQKCVVYPYMTHTWHIYMWNIYMYI